MAVLPSEAGGGIRRRAVHRCIEIRAASSMGAQYSKTVVNLFYDGSQTIGQAKPMRLESVEPVFETDGGLRGCGPRCRHRGVPQHAGLGDFLGFNSHLHVIATDGCFYGNGSFKACATPNPKDLEGLFRYEVFKMLKAEGKITDVIIEK